jgi:hypothetical protein
MSVYELRDLAILIAVTIVPAIALSLAILKFRAHWSRRRAIVVDALPVPAVIWVLCLALFVHSATASKEQCGVDACGMAMMASYVVGFYATVAFGAGLAVAWFVRRIKLR